MGHGLDTIHHSQTQVFIYILWVAAFMLQYRVEQLQERPDGQKYLLSLFTEKVCRTLTKNNVRSNTHKHLLNKCMKNKQQQTNKQTKTPRFLIPQCFNNKYKRRAHKQKHHHGSFWCTHPGLHFHLYYFSHSTQWIQRTKLARALKFRQLTNKLV